VPITATAAGTVTLAGAMTGKGALAATSAGTVSMVGGLKGRGAITASANRSGNTRRACYRISFNYRRTCWYCGAYRGRSLVRAQLSQLLLELQNALRF